MMLGTRIWLLGTVACAIMAVSGPAALGAVEFGVEKFQAATCNKNTSEGTPEECTYEKLAQLYTQAAGRPNYAFTDFTFNTTEVPVTKARAPIGNVKDVRVDAPVGLSVSPEAVPRCQIAEFEKNACKPEAKIGTDEITVLVPPGINLTIPATVYNLEQPQGVPAEFGVEVSLGPIEKQIYIEGGISWSTDYHEFFKISNISNELAVVRSRLIFEGRAGSGFMTLPSTCNGPQTTGLEVDSYQNPGHFLSYPTTTPVGGSGCEGVPFKPEIAIRPAPAQSDQPDGATVEVKVPQNANPAEVNSSTLKDANVTLPSGMTLDPSAANGLEACTDAQFGKGTAHEVECPLASRIGTVTVETPTLPPKSLTGYVYVGQPLSTNPESGQEYRIFIEAQSPRYGVSVRLLGMVSASASTGQLTTAVLENPQVPFSDFIVTLQGGAKAPLANPLVCGTATTTALLTPYTGGPAANPFAPFTVDFDGKEGACPSSLPFTLSQSTAAAPTTGGAATSFMFNLTRGDGQQYLSKVSTTLPPGLVGRIPSVTLCGEPQAGRGECTSASQIGTATVSVGAGTDPFTLTGPAYLTGPYAGAPYGLSVAVPAEKVGPFSYGTIVTRATISVNPFTARITVTGQLLRIVGGVPVRLRTLTVNSNRPNFMLNPTNCGVLSTDTLLTSTFGTTQSLSTPFQATGCSALAFNPKFTASTNAKTSRARGASLTVKVGYPSGPQANIKSVIAALPKQLPSRLSTLKNACLEATFNANPSGCPANSRVGEAVVATPVLPDKLAGPAIFVSHGGAAFPDLDLVLQGDGVTVILVGTTNITNGITTSNFAAVPDVPVSSFELKLPVGPNSVLAAPASLCKQSLVMPTTITAQNGKVIKQNTPISVSGCPARIHSHRLRILFHRVRGHKVIIVVVVPAAGRVSGGGKNLKTVHKHPRKAQRVTLQVSLSGAGVRALRAHHRLAVRVRVGFMPKAKGPSSAAFLRVVFR
jgi:hypothetical protein